MVLVASTEKKVIVPDTGGLKSKIPEGSENESWWDGPDRYQNANRNVVTAAQRDVLFDVVAALAPGRVGFDIGGPGFERNGYCCMGLNIVQDANHIVADATILPFKSNSIDYLVSSHALEHIIDLERAINEFVRVLKPGGLMGHKVPNFTFFQHDNGNPKHTQPELAPSEMTGQQMRTLWNRIKGIEILLMDTHQNNFDIDILARKTGGAK